MKMRATRNLIIAVSVIVIMLLAVVAIFTSGFFTAHIGGSASAKTPTQTPETSLPGSPTSDTAALSAVNNGLQLSIALTANKTTYAVREEVEITFAVTNVSNQTLNFINQNGDSNFNFQVYNSTNNVVYSWLFGAYPLDNWNLTLTPNESYTQNLIWSQESLSPSQQITSGAYYIIGELGYVNTFFGYVYSYPIQTTPNFQTAPLNITITN
jgi:hypothetical protein